MITLTGARRQIPAWQTELARAVTGLEELLALLELAPEQLPFAPAQSHFPLKVTRGFVARMEKGNPRDPLLLQAIPTAEEMVTVPGFDTDPVADHAAHVVPGILQKYHGRVLLLATGACAIHCRYCFRRHFPYQEANAARSEWADAMDYLHQHAEIEEVILSGGDPLMLGDQKLAALVRQLAAIPHLRRLRIHSRLPIVLPERITPELIEWFTAGRLQPVLVLHTNHPNELNAEVRHALLQLRDSGVTLLNQAVLLRHINHQAETQAALSRALFAAGVLPYYLHMLDPVQGAHHFQVSDTAALELMDTLNAALPGYLVPRLVREQPHARSKLPVNTSH